MGSKDLPEGNHELFPLVWCAFKALPQEIFLGLDGCQLCGHYTGAALMSEIQHFGHDRPFVRRHGIR
jgi:hypothetical protein